MDDKTAIDVLEQLLKKNTLLPEQQEALKVALGVLILTVRTSDSYVNKLKTKRAQLEQTD